MRILLTGATGFIGRAIVEELLRNGFQDLAVIVRKTSKSLFLQTKNIRLIYADIVDRKSLEQISNEYDVCFHCAGFVGVNQRMLHLANIVGTKNMCLFALTRGIKRFIYVSSVAVVSGNAETILTEEAPYRASNPYGQSKIEAEKIVLETRKRGLPTAILRPCMVYGEDEPHALGLVIAALRFRILPLFHQGKNKFHLVYVRTLAQAAVETLWNDQFLEGTFFLADKEVFSAREVFSFLAQGAGVPGPSFFPEFLTPCFTALPLLGEKVKFMVKDREYSVKRLLATGFSYRYAAQDALIQTGRSFRRI